MSAEILVIRLLHIIPGVVWAGSAVLVALVIVPRLKGGTMSDLGAFVNVAGGTALVMNITGTITILFGLALTFRTEGFAVLFSTGWGWAIGIGIVLSVLGLGTSGALKSSLGRLAKSISGSSEMAMISGGNDSLVSRVSLLAYLNAVLVIIAVGTMAAARFV